VIASIADKTLSRSETLDDFKIGFKERLATLARVQGLFFRMREGDRITFDKLLKTELSAQAASRCHPPAPSHEAPGKEGS
jgi:two-component system CheB/CheR fusion protein